MSCDKLFIDTYFGLDIKKFKRIMKATNAFISGSFALYWYLFLYVSRKTSLLPENSDMDIYIPGVSKRWFTTTGARSQRAMKHYQVCLSLFDSLLKASGYKQQSVQWVSRYYNSALIETVVTYTNEACRSIQLIFLNTRPSNPEVVTSTFDLDICKFVVNSELEVSVPASFKELTNEELNDRLRCKRMVQTLEHPKGECYKILQRLQKYYQRGFTVESCSKKLLTLEEAKSVVLQACSRNLD